MTVQPYVVLKRFGGPDHEYKYGEVVDATQWPNKQRMIRAGYIGLMEYGTTPVKDTGGRYWISEDTGRKANARFSKSKTTKTEETTSASS
jgi:hypothetical protein